MKKFAKILTSAFLAATMLSTAVSADDYEKLLVIGDSITTGYGLSGYVQGDNKSAAGSFANKLAEALGLDDECYTNQAIDGQTTDQLIENIDAAAVADADKIVISIGGNDYLIPLIDAIVASVGKNAALLEGYGVTVDASSRESALTALGMAALLDKSGEILRTIAADVASDDTVTALTEAVGKTVTNMNGILELILAENPDSEIYLLNIYNPFGGVALFGDISALADAILAGIATGYSETAERLSAEGYNVKIIDTQSAISDKAMIYTNIAKFDIHPNAAGHKLILQLLCAEMGVDVSEEAIDVSADVASTGNVTADNAADKANADTGIDSVTVFAGIALVAIGFAIASKRKGK